MLKPVKSVWIAILVLIIILTAAGMWLYKNSTQKPPAPVATTALPPANNWVAPDTSEWATIENGDQVRYGRNLISQTAYYLGPKGIVAHSTNGMNCQNCHIDAGTKYYGNNFSAVAATYPKFRNRSGRVESIEFRINDCLMRSLNGQPLDSLSKEMRAMVAYFKWVGKGVPKGETPDGAGAEKLSYLDRAADPQKGKTVYINKCVVCHGANGDGIRSTDSAVYVYPPLWGPHSYNSSAGLYRLSSLAGFVKNNMPFGATKQKPQLTDEEAWDVAAYISSQPRPKVFFKNDWPDLSKKPEDFPFGPYIDTFSEKQHKYGPFGPMKKKKDKA